MCVSVCACEGVCVCVRVCVCACVYVCVRIYITTLVTEHANYHICRYYNSMTAQEREIKYCPSLDPSIIVGLHRVLASGLIKDISGIQTCRGPWLDTMMLLLQ